MDYVSLLPPDPVKEADYKTPPPISQRYSHHWNVPLPAPRIRSLLQGFRPRDMDDKWFIYSSEPSSGGPCHEFEPIYTPKPTPVTSTLLARLWGAINPLASSSSTNAQPDSEDDEDEKRREGPNYYAMFESTFLVTHLCRSWTGYEIFRIHLEIYGKGREEVERRGPGRIIWLSWEGDEKIVTGLSGNFEEAKQRTRDVLKGCFEFNWVEEDVVE